MATRMERWKTLEQLDEWLRTPMLLLSLAWLIIVVVELTSGTSELLATVGTVIWILFILEFALRFALAPEKKPFLKRNWLTVIALVVPALRLFRAFAVLRAARALRGIRLVRIVGTANRSMYALRATLRRRQFGYVAGLTLLVLALGAAGMLSFEPAREVEGGFTSYGHALWWTGMLIASIGTDFWPTSLEGRVLSALLALYGLAVFGYITATFASFFIGRDAEEPGAAVAGAPELAALKEEIRALRLMLADGRNGATAP
ncbi:MAG TPA: ion transporter [Allosphingosinicella sp.]|nr:ion transporter [Allosphingosinicella sp.]